MKRIAALALTALVAVSGVAQLGAETKKYTIAGIVFQEDQFMKTIIVGMKDAAKKYNVNLLTANSSNQISKEVQMVNTYVARGVDAICVDPLDGGASSLPALQTANDKGIKVIAFDTMIKADFPSATYRSDDTTLAAASGKAAAAYIKANMAGKSAVKVGIINFKALLPAKSESRQSGFWNEIKDIPGVTLVAEASAPLVEEATKKAGDILTANPDLDIMFGCNDGGTKGAVLAVKSAKSKAVVFGFDVDKQMVSFLQSPDNILQAVTGQDPYTMGYSSIEAAVKVLKGESVEKMNIVPGKTLSRTNPNEIAAYAKTLK
jgi:sugar transport system substrate-binding protein